MLFKMFQTSVHDLFDSEQFGAEAVTQVRKSLIEALIDLAKALIQAFVKVAESLIIDQEANQHGQRWQSGADSRDHHLCEGTHL
ncbi:MAG TPA: hypothetical protein VK789_08740 [Bryobacteraceae bacterium]|nr:hypothetical protein [Bryobacteraceae bacterium]